MNIFEKRPLCLILCIGLCGFLLFGFENLILKISVIAIAILLLIISLFLRKRRARQLILLLSSVSILLASLLSFLYFDLYFKAYNLYEERVEIVGVVEEITSSSSYSQRLRLKVETVDGKRVNYHFYVYPTKEEAKGIVEGTRIGFSAELDGFSDESYTYNIAKGINAYASDNSEIVILEHNAGGITAKVSRLREYLTRYTISLSDQKSGAILSALLLGERDYLPDQLRLDFKRIGISHILALSGMHLAILSLGIGKALTFLKIKKKTRVAVTIIFVLLYMALTGFSVSVVRAGFMLIISSLLFLLAKSHDSPTSLSLAVLLICIIEPNAIMDISLWLSALATFGIIAFSEFSQGLEKPKSKATAIVRYFVLAIMASVFAISATMAVSTINFGGISILAPITTIIFSFLSEIIMYLGCLMLLIGWLIPIGWIVSPLCSLMSFLAGAFSSIKFAYVSSAFDFIVILVILYTIGFYLFLILKLKKPRMVLNALVILFAVITVLPTVFTISKSNTETVAYYSDYRCDEMLIRSKNEVCLINSAQYGKSTAYTSIDFLEEANVTYLDKYYITHYSWSIDEDVETLLYNVSIGQICIPEPRNDDEDTILKILKKSVENHRCELVVFREYETVHVGDYCINLLYSEPYGKTSVNAFSVAKRDEIYTYLSSGLLLDGKYEKYISLADHLILGDHGKKYKDRVYISDCYEDLDDIVIHSDNVFLKQENMMFFEDRGCNVYSHPDEVIYFVGK